MLDLKFIRENSGQVKAACVKKRMDVDVDRILSIDQDVRDLKRSGETLKAESNAKSKEIPKLSGAEREQALAALKELSAKIKEGEEKQKATEEQLGASCCGCPTSRAPRCRTGRTSPRTSRSKASGRRGRSSSIRRITSTSACRSTSWTSSAPPGSPGSRTYFLKNEGALLELAVLRLALDHMIAAGFTPMLPPHLVRDEAMDRHRVSARRGGAGLPDRAATARGSSARPRCRSRPGGGARSSTSPSCRSSSSA